MGAECGDRMGSDCLSHSAGLPERCVKLLLIPLLVLPQASPLTSTCSLLFRRVTLPSVHKLPPSSALWLCLRAPFHIPAWRHWRHSWQTSGSFWLVAHRLWNVQSLKVCFTLLLPQGDLFSGVAGDCGPEQQAIYQRGQYVQISMSVSGHVTQAASSSSHVSILLWFLWSASD